MRSSPLVVAILVAGCLPPLEPPPPPIRTEARIGQEGGTLVSADGLLRLEVPSGALEDVVTLTVERVGPDAYEIGPSGTRFARPASLSIASPRVGSAAWLGIATRPDASPDAWELLPGSRIEGDSVRGETSHLSPFAVVDAARIDLLRYVLSPALCPADGAFPDSSPFHGGWGIVPAAPEGDANGSVFFYIAKGLGPGGEIRGFEEWSVDDEYIYILSDYTWAGDVGEFVCDAEGRLDQHRVNRGTCMDGGGGCGAGDDFAATQYFHVESVGDRPVATLGARWLPRRIELATSRSVPVALPDMALWGTTMATDWDWIGDPHLGRCSGPCTSSITVPAEHPTQRDLGVAYYGAGFRDCATLEPTFASLCAEIDGGSWPSVVEVEVTGGPGDGERYWYALGRGWVGYQRTRGHGIEDRSGSGESPDWHMPSFDCRNGAMRTPFSSASLCGLLDGAAPPPCVGAACTCAAPDPADPTGVAHLPATEAVPAADCSSLGGPSYWECVPPASVSADAEPSELAIRRLACESGSCTEDHCAAGAACVEMGGGHHDRCVDHLECPEGRTEVLPGARSLPAWLALRWPFRDGSRLEAMQAYGRWAWELHYGTARPSRTNDEYALDLRPVSADGAPLLEGDPAGEVVAVAAGRVIRVTLPDDPSVEGFGNTVAIEHCEGGCPPCETADCAPRQDSVVSFYAHLSFVRPDLAPGTEVRAGESLGSFGHTGTSTPHLHFALYTGDATSGPLVFGATNGLAGGHAVVPEPIGGARCVTRGSFHDVSSGPPPVCSACVTEHDCPLDRLADTDTVTCEAGRCIVHCVDGATDDVLRCVGGQWQWPSGEPHGLCEPCPDPGADAGVPISTERTCTWMRTQATRLGCTGGVGWHALAEDGGGTSCTCGIACDGDVDCPDPTMHCADPGTGRSRCVYPDPCEPIPPGMSGAGDHYCRGATLRCVWPVDRYECMATSDAFCP